MLTVKEKYLYDSFVRLADVLKCADIDPLFYPQPEVITKHNDISMIYPINENVIEYFLQVLVKDLKLADDESLLGICFLDLQQNCLGEPDMNVKRYFPKNPKFILMAARR